MESLDVVARMLEEQLGAASVSFLITDFTGGSVVRLGAAGSVETTESLPRHLDERLNVGSSKLHGSRAGHAARVPGEACSD
ncbi:MULTISPECIES: hypothetical protein [unclassified Streptomyces]|uniref:hypothetical protein n=1 Tax=unclassified Streptomyces TaxID=2593676 RepID=UPI0034408555